MKPTRHIIVDLETLDTQPSAVIMTAGLVAVEITDHGCIQLGSWYRRIKWWDDDAKYGMCQTARTDSDETWEWWRKQSESAQHECVSEEERLPLWLALQSLNAWLQLNPYPIWGNGSDFDNAILQHALTQHGLRWPYWRNCCLRSTKNLANQLGLPVEMPTWPAGKIKHHALHDAEHEAEILAALLRAIDGCSQPNHHLQNFELRHLGTCCMTYQTYADHHITPRTEPPTDECETMRQPKETCGCPDCNDSRYPAELVESDGGEA